MTQRTSAISSKRGYSLIEVLIAMVILAIVAVALMKSSLLVMQKNVETALRDEAVRIGEQRMSELRTNPGGFGGVNPDGSNIDLTSTAGSDVALPDVVRPVRSATVVFQTWKNVADLDSETKQVTVTVRWSFGSQSYSHVLTSIVRD